MVLMRSVSRCSAHQRPPWRHSTSFHDEPDEDAQLEAQQRHHAVPFPNYRSSSSDRPLLRPPPVFHTRGADNSSPRAAGVLSASAMVQRESLRHLHRSPLARQGVAAPQWTPSSSSSPTTHHTSQKSSDLSPPVRVPLSHWGQATASAVHHRGHRTPSDHPDPSLSAHVAATASAEERHPSPGFDTESLAAREEESGMLCSAGVMEHYHIIELEEQLQYWRQHALMMEGRSLQRERAIKEKFAADFAAAQATSEGVIRKLLDRQRRLQQQIAEERQRRVSPQPVSAPSHSTSSSAVSPPSRAPREPRRSPVQENSRKEGQNQGSVHRTTRDDEEACVTNSAEEGARLAATTREAAAADRVANCAAPDPGSGPMCSASSCDLPSQIDALAEAFFACLEHSAELRQCCAALICAVDHHSRHNNTSTVETHSAAGDSVRAAETQQYKRIADRLVTLTRSTYKKEGDGSCLGKTPSSVNVTLEHQLATLQEAVQHLDGLLLTCVDDIVVAHRHWEEKMEEEATVREHLQLHQQQRLLQNYDTNEHHHSLRCLQQQHAKELDAARASADQLKRQLATTDEELQSARHDIQDLLEKQKADAAALREKQHSLQQLQQTHNAEVEKVRDELAHEVMEAARRVSAAEHACRLNADREAQWRIRLDAVAEARDAYAQECAVLKRRLEVLQLREAGGDRQRTHVQRDPYAALAGGLSWGAETADTAASTESLSAALQHVWNTAGSVASSPHSIASPLPVHASVSNGSHLCSGAANNTVATDDEQAARYVHADASTTPRRSLSYSPPASAERPPRRFPDLAHSAAGRDAEENARGDMQVTWTGEGSTKDRVKGQAMTSALPHSSAGTSSTPMYVVQPSVFADNPAKREDDDAAARADDVEGGHRSTATVPSAGTIASSTPLARMKAWEEKFKSILASA